MGRREQSCECMYKSNSFHFCPQKMLRRLCLRPLQQRTFLTSGRRRRRRLVGILMPPPRAGSGEQTTLTTSTTTTTSRKRRRRRKEEESEINDRQKWRSLEAGKDDLSLDRTLPTGQSFRWQKVNNNDENDEETERNDINNNKKTCRVTK